MATWDDVIAKLSETREAQAAVRAAATEVQQRNGALQAAQGEAEQSRAAESAAKNVADARFDELTSLITDLRQQS